MHLAGRAIGSGGADSHGPAARSAESLGSGNWRLSPLVPSATDAFSGKIIPTVPSVPGAAR